MRLSSACAALVLGLTTLTSCVDFRGLDLNQPLDAREYVQVCARSRSDVMCRAMLPVLKNQTGEVTVLLPNMSDDERAALLDADLARQGLSLSGFVGSAAGAAFARANIFAAPHLNTGQMTTLDGRVHQVTCNELLEAQVHACVIDGQLSAASLTAGLPQATGAVYPVGGQPAYLEFQAGPGKAQP